MFVLILLAALACQAQAVQQWRVLALRVDYPLEEPDEFTTTGTGQFDLRQTAEALADYTLPYDLPPHDRTFYERHLEALARYYRAVSDGEIEIDYAVYPRDNRRAYTLPSSALHYGNGRSSEEISAKWIELLRDATALADADPDGPVFAQYNSFLVIHAGLGHETGQFNDVRSVYLSPEDLAEPLPVDDGAFLIEDAWILPEAVSFRGQAGLNGLLAKFFGHQLGLPGLSNFADGLPAVGGWSLMDVGANRLGFVRSEDALDPVFGFVPPHPMAWTKARLGWVEPLTVRRDTTLEILATDRPGDLPRIVRVPIDVDEYFLLENRHIRGRTQVPAGIEVPFSQEDVSWLDPDQIEFADERGIWLGVEEYDAFVPGSGLLVWHVDAGVVEAGLAAGTLNNDPVRQGIALEEADGYRDIGNPLFDRIANIEGAPADAFFVGGTTLLGAETRPGTASNDGAISGIRIEVLSPPGDTLRVRIAFGRSVEGWPVAVGAGFLQAADIDGDGIEEALWAGASAAGPVRGANMPAFWRAPGRYMAAGDALRDGRALLYMADGEGVGAWREGASEPLWRQTAAGIKDGLFADGVDIFPGRSVVAVAGEEVGLYDAASGEQLWHSQASARQTVLADLDGDGVPAVIVESSAAVARLGADGPVSLWDEMQSARWLAGGDLDGDGRDELVAADGEGKVQMRGDDLHSRSLGEAAQGLALGDVDGDGLLEVVVTGAQALHVVRGDGLVQAGFPARLPRFLQAGTLRTGPMLADIDTDGRQEVFVGAASGVYGFDDDGGLLAGLPALTPAAVEAAPAALDVDGDGVLELAAVAGGLLYMWDTRQLAEGYTGANGAWRQRGGGADAARIAQAPAGPAQPPAEGLLPAARAYCYPNPVGPEDQAQLRFFLSGAARVDLEVFDALGQRVERVARDRPAVRAENEIAWSVAGYASGYYVCRLEARGESGGKEVVFVKMAVSR